MPSWLVIPVAPNFSSNLSLLISAGSIGQFDLIGVNERTLGPAKNEEKGRAQL